MQRMCEKKAPAAPAAGRAPSRRPEDSPPRRCGEKGWTTAASSGGGPKHHLAVVKSKKSSQTVGSRRRHRLAGTAGTKMATAQELFGAEAGAAPGLECWRIEAMKPLPNADALKGRFCEGEPLGLASRPPRG